MISQFFSKFCFETKSGFLARKFKFLKIKVLSKLYFWTKIRLLYQCVRWVWGLVENVIIFTKFKIFFSFVFKKIFMMLCNPTFFTVWINFTPIFLRNLCTVFGNPSKCRIFKNFPNWLFLAFLMNFCHLKCKRSSLRSQCWMRLFLWFSNTVYVRSTRVMRVWCFI